MSFSPSSSSQQQQQQRQQQQQHSPSLSTNSPPTAPPFHSADPAFDIFTWYPSYQSCARYFLDHAQHSAPVHAVAAFMNIRLPFQRSPGPILRYNTANMPGSGVHLGMGPAPGAADAPVPQQWCSLVPYLRRMVATGLDNPGVLHGFFGDEWAKGVGPLHEQERRNFLFAAKSGGWAAVKRDYDMLPTETVPFLQPMMSAAEEELAAAERTWSEWLAMEDWLVGSRGLEARGREREGQGSGGRSRR
ncbi:MAG: hypothetical protein M1829_002903 [Trizodia sp. TS-e1964]|nr:MAG: hypothetical protein M1829_002903 [Trizodia sp. TS-e1964]